ncbi:HlyD family secretion protein [Methylovirgula sp. 4M-Z18]|uniref:HlyD family secretion protein n=1 Tax=Methylovirgula sp. 4M-Z18 TaxID=2293567 RepID=UPI000E2EC2A1|nr:HlyD family secretion protein [Methylovirgula sp. 4M-Z18]RFB79403.1 HlyD family efflux transporter periplasmic adaptor subunit [Methylovirgula sp. 4M-Z18]
MTQVNFPREAIGAGGVPLGQKIGSKKSTQGSLVALKRGMMLTVATALCLLGFTSLFPQILTDQSDRAIIDAPVTLVTAPIAGEVTALHMAAGTPVKPDAPIAEIGNATIDRSTLIMLEGHLNDAEHDLRAILARQATDDGYLAQLKSDIDRATQILVTRDANAVADLQDQVGAAQAGLNERQGLVTRQEGLVAKKIFAPTTLGPVVQQMHAAEYQKQSIATKLQQKQSELESAKKGVFVGDDAHDLTALIQKRHDVEIDRQRLEIERVQASATVDSLRQQYDTESNRLTQLKEATIAAPAHGEVLSLDASVGRHLMVGDELARLTDCNAAFVVAIFSYRQGSNLAVGSRVSIDAGPDGNVPGTVTEILPKTSEKTDQNFALPFPQTERRELYVIVRPDAPIVRASTANTGGQCDIGRWVSVSRANNWVAGLSNGLHAAAADVANALVDPWGNRTAAASAH